MRESILSSFQRLSRAQALRRVDLSDTLAGIPIVRRTPLDRATRVDESSTGTIHNAIVDSELDVILRFGSARVDGHTLSVTRHGIWGINRTREPAYAAGPPSFWEIVNGESVTGGCLYRLTGEGEGVVLREGYVETIGHMPGRSLDAISFECARWPTYAVAEIANGAPELQTHGVCRGTPKQSVPTWFDLTRFFIATAKSMARRMRRRSLVDEWHVGVLRMKLEEIMDGKPLNEVHWLPDGPQAWYADPFARSSDGKIVVLLEKMPLKRGKVHTTAQIASVILDETGWGVPELALDTGSHASYPCLIETDGKIFMAPETWQLNELGLYEAIDFPHRWKKVGVLLPGIPATDATVFQHEGKWWILCTTRDANVQTLLAFYADSLFGPWRGHRQNPLKIDVRGARPAGRPFEIGGKLYRPSQDCSQTYGGRIIVHQIRELNTERWSEEQAFIIKPEPAWPYNQGLHTISVVGDVCIIDAKRFVS